MAERAAHLVDHVENPVDTHEAAPLVWPGVGLFVGDVGTWGPCVGAVPESAVSDNGRSAIWPLPVGALGLRGSIP